MDFKKLIPHLIAAGVLLAVACAFFAPNVFGGKVLPQPDNEKARAIQTEIMNYWKDGAGEAPLWTNSLFGGMPSYQIYSPAKGNLTAPLAKVLYLGQGISSVWAYVFVAMLTMYLFLAVLKLDWRVAIFGALAYGITTYNVDILEAGHSTKMSALALTPGILAGAATIMRGRFLPGFALTAIFTAWQVNANHLQITYYTMILLGMYLLIELIYGIKHRVMPVWGMRWTTLSAALILGFLSNVNRLWPTYEYGKETIRGGSDLQSKAHKGDGLDEDYLFGWSYGVDESLTLVVPHAFGGGNHERMAKGEFYELVTRGRSPQEKESIAQQVGSMMYYGKQPFVGTAIYMGVIIVFLFFVGAVLETGMEKWWLLTGAVFMLMLAWGKNFFLNHIFFDYLPMFNKFRAVSMALGMTQLFAAALAAVGLQKLFDPDFKIETKRRALFIAGGATLALCLLVLLMAGGEGPRDAELVKQINIPNLQEMLIRDRAALARSDAFRSIGFLAAAFGVLWFALRGTYKAGFAVVAVAALSLIDNWMVSKRTLSNDKFEDKKTATAVPPPSAADKKILDLEKDGKDPHYRVLDFQKGQIQFNYGSSFYHKSMSGYHAAKIQRYQEVVDSVFNMNKNVLRVAGMFNAKYVVSEDGNVITNPYAGGHAWFIKAAKVVNSADEEIQALRTLNPLDTVVVWSKYDTPLRFNILPDTSAYIRLTSYHPDKMEYEYSAKTPQFAVFPEIYYPDAKGWHCYLDGERISGIMTKVNYTLRGAQLPAGEKRKFEMRFEPTSFYTGETVSMVASLIVLLGFFGGLFFWFRKHQMPEANQLEEIEATEATEKPKKVAPVAPVEKPKKTTTHHPPGTKHKKK